MGEQYVRGKTRNKKGKVASWQRRLLLPKHQSLLTKGATLHMNTSREPIRKSCTIHEVFDANGLTAHGGANLLIDFLRNNLRLRDHLERMPLKKADWADYSLAQDIENLVVLRALGMERIHHLPEYAKDPLLTTKLGMEEFPHPSLFYRTLDRFEDESDVAHLTKVNKEMLPHVTKEIDHAILDIDTTVETVFGHQEGSEVAYNPRYRGRASYQPMIAFEGQTGAGVHVEHRPGKSSNAEDKINFYRKAKAQLPADVPLRFVRADKEFTSEAFCCELESDGVGYALKLRMTSGVMARVSCGVLWTRIHSGDTVEIEVGSVGFKANGWTKHRRVVLIRTRHTNPAQPGLFPELSWSYQAIVTDQTWDPEDVWHFYNQRATCENYIKELKYGLDIDAISKATFWPNAADLSIKMIAYNVLLAFKNLSDQETKTYSIRRLRRVLLNIPGKLVKHARQWTLRLPSWWPHQEKWWRVRRSLLQT